ncbi:hypothetical protein SASPL_158116 [Salvia splendens]|uniref:N-acetyltransferase domain-containing protein n=1 Tax=Salvia splendens TaxID=180675 RepID=A0A8X8VTU2_SALSN|nr:hypothetical protein SASPL_158116 [Salvia splendens]
MKGETWRAVEELEQRCEVGQPGKPSLVTDLMGDPIARVRNFGNSWGDKGVHKNGNEWKEKLISNLCELAYILGLRVSSTHRRLGIAIKLVQELEEWCKKNGADYAYMATECSNQASLNLFTQKCNYMKFRNPTVLVQPVHLHHKPLPSDITIVRVPPNLAESMLRVKGVSSLTHAACLGTRVVDAMAPWLKIPSIPNIFKNFGFYFMYGLHMEGQDGPRLLKALCKMAHNMARNDSRCRVVVAEVGQNDPVREAIPHWKKFSWDEDIWCIKRFGQINQDYHEFPVSSSSPIFVDPRDL